MNFKTCINCNFSSSGVAFKAITRLHDPDFTKGVPYLYFRSAAYAPLLRPQSGGTSYIGHMKEENAASTQPRPNHAQDQSNRYSKCICSFAVLTAQKPSFVSVLLRRNWMAPNLIFTIQVCKKVHRVQSPGHAYMSIVLHEGYTINAPLEEVLIRAWPHPKNVCKIHERQAQYVLHVPARIHIILVTIRTCIFYTVFLWRCKTRQTLAHLLLRQNSNEDRTQTATLDIICFFLEHHGFRITRHVFRPQNRLKA
ncbi:hypothetical protein FVE85_6181 [Porphyridium purpureum]|uniref:Uncharacterized protein n=1 Tax=Porphyridium purpureum TaxID=35688 RepID=A0A5J4Z4K7_PORPP|nr:hypothetical protein FVE85_6181 [Porphyridium purpureum]|eukprot:POR5950..scf295_1